MHFAGSAFPRLMGVGFFCLSNLTGSSAQRSVSALLCSAEVSQDVVDPSLSAQLGERFS